MLISGFFGFFSPYSCILMRKWHMIIHAGQCGSVRIAEISSYIILTENPRKKKIELCQKTLALYELILYNLGVVSEASLHSFLRSITVVNWFIYRFVPAMHGLRESRLLPRLAVLAIVLIISVTFSSCDFSRANSDEDSSVPDELMEQSPSPSIAAEPPEIKTHESDSPEPSDTPEPEPVPPDIPLQEVPADDEFFEDAAFMGNSLMNGFETFSEITTPDYYTATSMTVIGATSKYCVNLDNGNAGTMLDGVTQKQYGKIYILLGINEIGMNVDAFIEQYGAMLDKILEVQENCDVYVMGLSPVSMAKSSDPTFSMDRVRTYNEALYNLAKEKGCWYMDLVEALADDTGYLPSNETADGVHLSANLYSVWADYVRTHYVPHESQAVDEFLPPDDTSSSPTDLDSTESDN